MISPPTFLADSSSWNYDHVVSSSNDGSNHELPKASVMPEIPRQGGHGCRPVRRMEPTPTLECMRLARTALPLKCPRCESTNTKFSYFNNHKLSQPRHLCHACHRYWTHGGRLYTVQAGASRRRHQAKRPKPKLVASVPAGSSVCTTDHPTTLLPPLPPQLSISDSEITSLGSDFTGMVDTVGYYTVSSGSGSWNAGLEQWRVQQTQSFPFCQGMDKGVLVSSSAAAIPGLFHYLDVSVDGSGIGSNGKKNRRRRAICDSIQEQRLPEGRIKSIECASSAPQQNQCCSVLWPA